ncbi:BREX-2 system adenine-specific DNA-methyltransferase PglX [Mycobacterium sp. ENV421]|uniref:BREX-2 system adenine-specific DNA-methyltransferase PglX n=1 Tax=Mycobacterium sp. ENV421 TaxID=1213407 RepID=UPI001E2B7CAB|nr:BREX-2 system adenine-specific DNA-methyltransferase PglX [Mycobacterium sp. ENV421]
MRHARGERITTCGSGHFLLGAFHRLHEQWQRHAPALGPRELVEKALDGIYGVDINPFAVAIARFRLLVAALHAAGDSSIEERIGYKPHLAAGDSLRWGANQQLLPEDLLASGHAVRADTTENAEALTEILQREHDVVVGNPPYITVKDAALNSTYRDLYKTPHRKYALTVPFMELFFRLAWPRSADRPTGWVGQITSNAFMKREFGSKLIEEFLPTVELRGVIDTSGAYIPGHGTPTTIIVGRNQRPATDTIRTVLGIRGEPGRPTDAAKGLVWTTITQHIDEPGHEDTYISVTDLPRSSLSTHPWSLSGGGAVELLELVNRSQTTTLGHRAARLGVFGMTNADEVMLADHRSFERRQVPDDMVRALTLGDEIRDWNIDGQTWSIFPYGPPPLYTKLVPSSYAERWLWPCRTVLGNRATFGKQTYFEEGRPWYEWHQLTRDPSASILTITFAFVATHNHFVLDRGGKVFKQSAPVIKLPEGASVEDHLRLLGVLNSSVACFWLKQNSYPKGGDPIGQDGARVSAESWSDRYEFTGTTLQDFPLPASTPVDRAKVLDGLAVLGH